MYIAVCGLASENRAVVVNILPSHPLRASWETVLIAGTGQGRPSSGQREVSPDKHLAMGGHGSILSCRADKL